MGSAANIRVQVVAGDIREFPADVLVLKFARFLFGADEAVHEQLTGAGIEIQLPDIGEITWCEGRNHLAARYVLFVGVNHIAKFGYGEIRDFAAKALTEVANKEADIEHITLTLHGPGYGLDEIEAFRSELAGIADAIERDEYPRRLRTISFVERDERRAGLLRNELEKVLPEGLPVGVRHAKSYDPVSLQIRSYLQESVLQNAGYESAAKPHVFVAMPFAEEMDDVYHYGIQGAVKAAGLLCERSDFATFTGDVMEWIKKRISTATLVIADLTTANPNVYLEVGYAWGRNISTVLLLKEKADDLKFDTHGQRRLTYKNIQHLEELLTRELQILIRGAPAG